MKSAWVVIAAIIGCVEQGAGLSSELAVGEGFDMVAIAGGSYPSLFKLEEGSEIAVDKFYLDRFSVTNREYLAFVDKSPQWSKDHIKPIFSDGNYLKHVGVNYRESSSDQPVTNVSWFSVRAYCKSLNKRLPTVDEWEYVARASSTLANGSKEPGYRQMILDWYAKPASLDLPRVADTAVNYWGVHGMHGVVWEMVNDFNTALVTGESRGDSQLEKQLFCGAGAASSIDPGDYAAFMRYALRSSYSAHYTMESLGFRCARDMDKDSL